MIELFHKGGPIMWPLLICSLAALTVVIERAIFILTERRKTSPAGPALILEAVADADWATARDLSAASTDPADAVLAAGLATGPGPNLNPALQRAAAAYLHTQARGLSTLDTLITAGPLLGLLGTVTGMIRAFSIVGGDELGAPTAITGGIAEALIATSFGLGIAIVALFPFNYLNTRLERVRHQLQDACTAIEIAANDQARTPTTTPPGA